MLRSALCALPLIAAAAQAEVPRVATDIAPVHGLVSMVMGDLGTPSVILPPGASPHDLSLRPSDARALQDADLVVWIGPTLTPGIARPLDTLAARATQLTLADVAGTRRLEPREAIAFDEDHDGHGEDHGHDHGHDHGGAVDPHLWLDPANARLWLGSISAALTARDPENAATYTANAAAAATRIDTAEAEARAVLASVQDLRFVAAHDAYHYFEEAFDLRVAGAISISDAAPPGPARLAALRDLVAKAEIACFVAEPQFAKGLIDAVSEGTLRPVILADPLGTEIAPGAEFYPTLIRDLAAQFARCAAPG